MNNRFRIKRVAGCLILFLLFLLPASILCQIPAANTAFDKLVKDAKAILEEGNYAYKPARAAALQKRLEAILAEIDGIGPHLKLAENRSLREIFITRLNKRKKAYQLVIDGQSEQLPSKGQVEAREVQDCISLLTAYVADTASSVFVDANRFADVTVRKNFLEQLTPCLSAIAKNENSLRKADMLLTKMFVYKRIDFVQWLNLLENDPEAASRLSKILVHKDKLDLASRILSEIIRAGDDSQRLSELIHGLFSATDSPTLVRVFEKILIEFGDNPEKMAWLRLQIARAANLQSQHPALAPLLDLMDRVRDERLLSNILRLLQKTLPPNMASAEWQTAMTIQRIQNEVLRQAGDQFEMSKRLNKLAEKAKLLLQQPAERKLYLAIPTIWRTGDFDATMDARYYRTLVSQLAKAFETDYIVNASTKKEALPDTLKYKIGATSGEPVDSTFLDYFNRLSPTRDRSHIIAAGTYTFRGASKPLTMQLYLIDAETGIVLGVYHQEMAFDKDLGRFASLARDAANRIAAAFKSELTAYLKFEVFAKTFSADAVDLKNFRSYLFYDTIFEVEPGVSYDSLRGIVAEKIYIEQDFFTTYAEGKRFSPLLDTLRNVLVAAYPEVPPVVAGEAVKGNLQNNFLYLAGEQVGEGKGWEMRLQIRRAYLDVLNLHLKFRPNPNADVITPGQAKYAAGFITESVKSFLGHSQKFFHEKVDASIKDTISVVAERFANKKRMKPISRWNAMPSLLLPGSSQLIIADRLDSASVSSTRRLGKHFIIAAAVLFGTAIYFDQVAIDQENNDKLKVRNGLVAGAGAMGLISACLASRAIGKHNQNGEQGINNTKQPEKAITQKK